MIYSGNNRGPFKNKQARADFIQESFQSITDKKRYLSMGFVRQQPCCLNLQVWGEPSQSQSSEEPVWYEKRDERYHDYFAVCHIFAIAQTSRAVLNTVSVSENYTQYLYV